MEPPPYPSLGPVHTPAITLFSLCSLELLTKCSALSASLSSASAGVSQVPATHTKCEAKASWLDLGSDL